MEDINMEQINMFLIMTYNKLEQAGLLNTWKWFSNNIIKQIKQESNKNQKLSLKEISNISISYITKAKASNNADLQKLFNVISDIELHFLCIALINDFENTINPKNHKEFTF